MIIRGFIDGVTAYLKAFRLITRLRLWGYVVVPGLVSMVLAVLIFGLAWSLGDDLGARISRYYPPEWWGSEVVQRLANVFGGLLVVVLGLILFKHLVMALASPFMSFLSETIEKKLRGAPPVAFSPGRAVSDLVRGLTIALRNILRELFFTILLFLLGLIPLFSPFTTLLIFLVQSYYAGFGNMDFTLERHFRVRDSVRFIRRHRGVALGNGVIFMLLLLTGIGFLFALPLGAVAATTETLKRLETEQG